MLSCRESKRKEEKEKASSLAKTHFVCYDYAKIE
jgi:hypothetical protein